MGSRGYGATVLPRLSRLWLGGRFLAGHRASLLAQVHGRVLEVGFGSGTSLPYYPADVRELVGLDVSATALAMARRREPPPFPVGLIRGTVEQAPLREGSFDFVVTTWLLCLLPDPARALGRMRRLLTPGGRLRFLEHGRTESRAGQAAQSFLTPVTSRLCGGCRLNRPIDRIIGGAGFRIEHLVTRHLDPAGLVTVYEGCAAPLGEPAAGRA